MATEAKMDVPDNANSGCVGASSEQAGKADGCAGCPNQSACASGAGRAVDPAAALVANRMTTIKHTILVLSGKGGVGKSTFSCQLAHALAGMGKEVGLLDVDICGPSVPRMLGLQGQEVHRSASGWSPVYVEPNLGVMSIGFMLPNADDAIIWRGPRKNGLIKQFLTDVHWGDLDYLIVDTPPGTSDEHISIIQYLKDVVDGAVVVTTPQEVSMSDVRKELNFCKKTHIDVLGVVENMSGLTAPVRGLSFTAPNGAEATDEVLRILREKAPELLDYSIRTEVFPAAGAGPRGMAEQFAVPYLGAVPMDANLLRACEQGESFLATQPDSAAAGPFRTIVESIIAATPDQEP